MKLLKRFKEWLFANDGGDIVQEILERYEEEDRSLNEQYLKRIEIEAENKYNWLLKSYDFIYYNLSAGIVVSSNYNELFGAMTTNERIEKRFQELLKERHSEEEIKQIYRDRIKRVFPGLEKLYEKN